MGTRVLPDLTELDPADRVLAGPDLAGPDLAGGRVVPVAEPFDGLLPEGGLVRGRTVACVGPAAPALALALVARETAAGSWLALVGAPWVGLEAARELGVALERTVAVEPTHSWADCVAAAVDGFDLVVAVRPATVTDAVLRRMHARLRTRGGVLVLLDDPTSSSSSSSSSSQLPSADLVVIGRTESWEGIGRGHGRLTGRRLRLTVTGRRAPRPRTAVVPVPGALTSPGP